MASIVRHGADGAVIFQPMALFHPLVRSTRAFRFAPKAAHGFRLLSWPYALLVVGSVAASAFADDPLPGSGVFLLAMMLGSAATLGAAEIVDLHDPVVGTRDASLSLAWTATFVAMLCAPIATAFGT